MSATGGNGAILSKALKDLMIHWDRTETSWRDRAREDFDRDFLKELAPAVRAASTAIQQIEEFIRQVEKECG